MAFLKRSAFVNSLSVCAIALMCLTANGWAQSSEQSCTNGWFDCSPGHYCKKEPGDCIGAGVCTPIPEPVCPPVWAPVCGCNGATFGNACEAEAFGVNIAYEGECVEIACEESEECPNGFWCSKADGDCDGVGECVPVLDGVCILVYAPVCGCDGQTYDNWCFAAAAGVNIAHQGPCDDDTGPAVCQSNEQCPFGHYCQKQPGDCNGNGVCAQMPVACPDVWDPVCGCDGVTYSNDCDAAAAGVNVAHEGECGAACWTNDDCAEGFYCDEVDGHCDGPGQCLPLPEVCILIYAPVCGCDGVTYGNSCFAKANGVNVLHPGPCDATVFGTGGCSPSNPCPFGYWCSTPPGECDADGVCVPLFPPGQLNCLDVWAPVCGCDGNTYSNDCYAMVAGVSVAHEGECGSDNGPIPGSCPADLNASGSVDVFDLLTLLSNWGSCAAPCPADLTSTGVVDVFDLLELLSNWGPCP